ncbi:FAD-linked oxidase C-terminal domain-containing protein [Longispora sp. NPDC051575]|uniref:FAD-binding oxidoreductase n=1 Tax=Longispora sp. NPDC051575 TaxID=3154943 RepID=UPI003448B751
MGLTADLRAALGDRVLTDPDVLETYRRDEADLCPAGVPLAVVRPRSTAEVVEVVRIVGGYGVPIVPQGARTGLAGGANAVDGCVVLSMTAMADILEIDPVNRLAVVQPGVVNSAISAAVLAHGLTYPPDPGSWESSTIGGNVSTDAGGMCCVKYGVTSRYVLGLEVVLADGEVLRTGRRTAKGVAGYDLTKLFVGSEGTLGVITEITLSLRPTPGPALGLAAIFPGTAAAGAAVTAIVAGGHSPSLLELIDRTHLRALEAYRPMGLPTDAAALLLAAVDTAGPELEALADLCRAAGATEVHVATDEAETAGLLAARRNAHPAMERLGKLIIDDVAVPVSRLAELLDGVDRVAEKHGVTIGVVGHAGDGNMHPNIVVTEDNVAACQAAFDEIMALGLALGGTCSGEHGVGLLKRDWLARELGPVGVRVHHAIKAALDPRGLLNPGKVLPGS